MLLEDNSASRVDRLPLKDKSGAGGGALVPVGPGQVVALPEPASSVSVSSVDTMNNGPTEPDSSASVIAVDAMNGEPSDAIVTGDAVSSTKKPKKVPKSPKKKKQKARMIHPAHPPQPVDPSAWQGPQHAVAAVKIQKVVRGVLVRTSLQARMNRLVGKPSLARAREHARSLLPKDQAGELLPLNCPIECFQVFGTGVYCYMLWMQLMKRTFFVAFLFAFANLVQNTTGGQLQEQQSWLSIHTFGNVPRLDASYGASELLILCTLLYGMFEAVRLVNSAARTMQSPQTSEADQTIQIDAEGAAFDRDVVRQAMAPYGAVRHVTVVYDVRDVLLRLVERLGLLRDLHSARCEFFLRGWAPTTEKFEAKGGKSSKPFWQQAELNAALKVRKEGAEFRLQEHDAASCAQVLGQKRGNVGRAFVTFEQPEGAEAALKAISEAKEPSKVVLASFFASRKVHPEEALLVTLGGGQKLHAKKAPEPTNILWENAGADQGVRRKRQLLSTGLMLALSLAGTAVIMTTIWFQSEGSALRSAVDPLVREQEPFSGLIISLLLQLAMVLPVIAGNVLLFWTVPPIAERFERHHTHDSLELSIALKCTFFQVLNTVLSAAVFFFDGYTASNTRQWYALGGALLVNILFGDFIFIQVLLDWVRIDIIVARCCLARRARSQSEMDRIYAAPAGIYLAFRIQQAGKYLVLAPMFGSAIPVLFLIAAAYFWLGSWIDRHNLLRRLAPPPATDETLTKAAALYIFPTGIVLHVVMALVFFAHLPLLALGEKGAAISQSPNASSAVNVSLAALRSVNASVNASSGATVAANALTATAGAASGSGMGWQAWENDWLPFWMVVGTAGLAICAMSVFIIQNSNACACCRRLIPGHRAKSVLRVIAGEPAHTDKGFQDGTTTLASVQLTETLQHHSYTPPLPHAVKEAYLSLKPRPVTPQKQLIPVEIADDPASDPASDPAKEAASAEPLSDTEVQVFETAEEAADVEEADVEEAGFALGENEKPANGKEAQEGGLNQGEHHQDEAPRRSLGMNGDVSIIENLDEVD